MPEDRAVAVNGLRLHYLDWGNSRLPALIFLHGFAQQAHSWDFAALALRHRFHCVSVDLRGHGDSDWSPQAEYGLDYYVADVEALVRALACARPVVCGLSMGGRIAYTHASRNPEGVRALVVAEAAPESRPSGRRAVLDFTAGPAEFDTFEDAVARTLAYNSRRTPEQVRGSLRHSVRQRPDGKWTWKWDPALRHARSPSVHDTEAQWAALSRVRCPTLFVLGAKSEMVGPETLRRMVASVPGSTAETVENAGHLVAGDNPAGFDAAVQRFFGRAVALGMPE
jgi:pimeloyl-ACP methyl ester carboxylesterase